MFTQVEVRKPMFQELTRLPTRVARMGFESEVKQQTESASYEGPIGVPRLALTPIIFPIYYCLFSI